MLKCLFQTFCFQGQLYFISFFPQKLKQWSNGLVAKELDSRSRGPVFKTTGWLQGRLSLSSFRGFNPEHWDSIPQTGTDLAKSRQLECLQKQVITNMTSCWDIVKYLDVLHHNRTQKQLQYFLIYCKNLTNFFFWLLWACLF